MPTLRPLSPAPEVDVPQDAPECKIVAVEAGRSSDGLVASLHGGNGTVQVARLVRLMHPGDVEEFAASLAEATLVAPIFIQEALIDLACGVETALRNVETAATGTRHHDSQASQLVAIAESAVLFHDPSGDAYATIGLDDHRETHGIRTKGFRRWLAHEYYRRHEKAPGSQALQDALVVLEGRAQYEGSEHPVYTRLAEDAGAIYVDLGNEKWDVIEICAQGWRVVSDAPVKFRRSRGMLALPSPVEGGSLDLLALHINVDGEDDLKLLTAWLLAAMNPRGPYPVLLLHGEQGAAKSTTGRVLRNLIDPNKAPLRAEPKEPRDLIVAAQNGWIIALDNLSHLSPWLSDGLCRLSTGGGFSTRELYSDADEFLFDGQRPVLINAIEELSTRGDLLDRSIICYLPNIKGEDRIPEKRFWARFEQDQPRILGALCHVVSSALATVDRVDLHEVPRMADFALWVTAAEGRLSWEPGAFLTAYNGNRETANTLALESSPIVEPLTRLAKTGYLGTATALLTELNTYVESDVRKQKGWPTTPRGLSGLLRRLAPNLRGARIDVVFLGHQGQSRDRLIAVQSYQELKR